MGGSRGAKPHVKKPVIKKCRRHATLHAVGGVLQGFTPVKKRWFSATSPSNYVQCMCVGLSPWGYSPGIACVCVCVCACVYWILLLVFVVAFDDGLGCVVPESERFAIGCLKGCVVFLTDENLHAVELVNPECLLLDHASFACGGFLQ
jgi:hypothetical protein